MRILFIITLICSCLSIGQQSPHGEIHIPCATCHSTDSWTLRSDATFNHNSTGFPLEGQHRFVECSSCHENLVFTTKNSDCASCHTDIHRQELGTNCLRCHTMQSWVIADMKQQHQQTRFPLVGKHALAACEQCHSRASTHQYAGTPLMCISCHKQEFDATTSPSHVASGFPIDCNRCHKIESMTWGDGFDHNLTRFPLTGAHRATVCSDCHKNNQFTALSTNCYDCHSTNFTSAQSPNHVTGNFSHECLSCHTTTAWQPSTFDHTSTAFPLTGTHGIIECQSCHLNGNYQLHYANCYQCHQPNFEQTTNPNHVTENFSHDCQTCHTTTGWLPAAFDHNTTAFQLTGTHGIIECQTCHANGNYQLRYTGCYSCHQVNFEQTTNPNHVIENFSHDCQTCHTTTGWQPASFDHNTTSFPLTGKHTSTLCQSCHANNNFRLVYTDCYQCHQSDYQRPTDPNHVTANFDHNCLTCHTTTVWIPSTFNHDQQYFRIYSGRHIQQWASCADCHQNNANYAQYSCLNCHAHNQTTMNSAHAQVTGYSYTSPACYNCHRNV